MKKQISLLLLAVFLISAICPTAVLAKEPDVSTDGNRYYYRYETSDRMLMDVTHISARDVTNTTRMSNIVLGILGVIPGGAPASLSAMIIDMCIDMNAAGTLYTYKTVKNRI